MPTLKMLTGLDLRGKDQTKPQDFSYSMSVFNYTQDFSLQVKDNDE